MDYRLSLSFEAKDDVEARKIMRQMDAAIAAQKNLACTYVVFLKLQEITQGEAPRKVALS